MHTFTEGEEAQTLLQCGITQIDQLVGHGLQQGQETALDMPPGLRTKLLGHWLHTLHGLLDANLKIPLYTVQGPENRYKVFTLQAFDAL